MLYGTVVTSEMMVAFEGKKGTGDRAVITPLMGSRVRLTAPRLFGARPVVWYRVVTSLPVGGIRWRSDHERYSSRTW
ncbi:hypothetical protein IEQ34_009503 [Dendrobium chrysotoxum]|uniref:Uncharacterized protein n=1 Tax=Dendrobium chrysotoxum TaxID=161865 RepID=A0AAV7H236_DENCH|nr:hypothetical protein IEQ34_009503 [Dendrobium chrysotoxum]